MRSRQYLVLPRPFVRPDQVGAAVENEPPWLASDGGVEVPTAHEPPSQLARTVATCTLGLPIQLCGIETIDELEQRNHFPAWEHSPWLAGELVLVLDGRGEAEVYGHHLRYDPQDGLVVTRER